VILDFLISPVWHTSLSTKARHTFWALKLLTSCSCLQEHCIQKLFQPCVTNPRTLRDQLTFKLRDCNLENIVLAWNHGSSLAILKGSSSLDESMLWLNACSCLLGSDWSGSSHIFYYCFMKVPSYLLRHSFYALSSLFEVVISLLLFKTTSSFSFKLMLGLIVESNVHGADLWDAF